MFYPTYPYFDQWGINVVTSGTIGNEDATNLTTNAYRLWVDPGSYSFNEWVSDFYAGYWYFTYSAAAIFQPTSAISASALQAQCSPTYGSTVQLSWCYYIDGMATKQPFFSYAYGTATATGPAMRNGRMAYTLQTMNGVRSITNSTGVPGQYQTNSTAIIYLEYMQADLDLDLINNNLLYTTQPYEDQQGLIYATSNGPISPTAPSRRASIRTTASFFATSTPYTSATAVCRSRATRAGERGGGGLAAGSGVTEEEVLVNEDASGTLSRRCATTPAPTRAL